MLRASLDDFKRPWSERNLYDRTSGEGYYRNAFDLEAARRHGVFAYRPEIDSYWDLRIWVEIDAELSVRRGVERDREIDGGAEEAEALHRDRYLVGELLYIDEVDPRSFVEIIVDNTDVDRPRIIRPAGTD